RPDRATSSPSSSPRIAPSPRGSPRRPASSRSDMTYSYARSLLHIVAAVVAVRAATPFAAAQDYPSRPVRIVFPLAAGGGGDVFPRAIADELQKAWRQPVVVENRPGGR